MHANFHAAIAIAVIAHNIVSILPTLDARRLRIAAQALCFSPVVVLATRWVTVMSLPNRYGMRAVERITRMLDEPVDRSALLAAANFPLWEEEYERREREQARLRWDSPEPDIVWDD